MCLRVHRECEECIYAYMGNTANVGLFAVHRNFSEYAERIYAYMDKTQRKSWRIRRIRRDT
jgi:hypothetical protein